MYGETFLSGYLHTCSHRYLLSQACVFIHYAIYNQLKQIRNRNLQQRKIAVQSGKHVSQVCCFGKRNVYWMVAEEYGLAMPATPASLRIRLGCGACLHSHLLADETWVWVVPVNVMLASP